MMKLHGYFRSSTSYRVRIALNLKGLDYRQVSINLVQGAQRSDDYRALNPQGIVPTLETDDGLCLFQSLAICEYLEERHPEPPLLPAESAGRARVRAIALLIACEMHPVNNLRILKYLTDELGVDEEAKLTWYRHWIAQGFEPLETLLNEQAGTGDFCHGDTPTLADVCLVPQVFNAERFDCELSRYPTIRRIAVNCNALEAFEAALPYRQPDAS